MSETALRFTGVVKNFGRAQALRGVTFDVAPGEFFGLVGVNGAGKTTLLKCLLDFCNVSDGAIEIFGTPHHLTAARRRLAFLPERFNPPYYLTGEDFIRYVLDMQSTPFDRTAAEEMLRAFDLDLKALKLACARVLKGHDAKTRARRLPAVAQGFVHPRRAGERARSQSACAAQGAVR